MSINGCKHFQEALDIRTGPLMVHSRGFLCYLISCFIVALIYLDRKLFLLVLTFFPFFLPSML